MEFPSALHFFRVKMKAKYPTEERVPREFKTLTNLTYFTRAYNKMILIRERKKRGAYNEAICSTYNKELCISVCCMINELSSDFLTSVITALDAIGIKHVHESQTQYVGINTYVCPTDNKLRKYRVSDDYSCCNVRGLFELMDWPTVLVYFGCCILILYNKFSSEENYKTCMTNSICQLRERELDVILILSLISRLILKKLTQSKL
ncbi:unnamed protein product [Vicia faba]|uniref:Uncharacterized protein n=1 Tax=Vicia faba TaxID=3906 RepID=A0AAV0YYL6_VICFA|nr:unnamed protein product [Vicia faba]